MMMCIMATCCFCESGLVNGSASIASVEHSPNTGDMTKICEEKVKGDSGDDEETGGDVFDDPLAPAADPIAHEIDNLKRDIRRKFKDWNDGVKKAEKEASAAALRRH